MERDFYDLDIQSELSSGSSSIEDIINIGERLGYRAIAISDFLEERSDLIKLQKEIEQINQNKDLDVYLGAKVRANDIEELKNKIKLFRASADVLIVDGGNVKINRSAAEDSRVDILSRPEYKRKDSGLDHVIAKSASDNNVAVEINLNQLIKTKGKLRSHILGHMRRNVRLAEKYGVDIITSSGAEHAYQLRSPREMAAFPHLLGISLEKAMNTVSQVPKRILDRTRKVKKESFIRPGQEKIDSEE